MLPFFFFSLPWCSETALCPSLPIFPSCSSENVLSSPLFSQLSFHNTYVLCPTICLCMASGHLYHYECYSSSWPLQISYAIYSHLKNRIKALQIRQHLKHLSLSKHDCLSKTYTKRTTADSQHRVGILTKDTHLEELLQAINSYGKRESQSSPGRSSMIVYSIPRGHP